MHIAIVGAGAMGRDIVSELAGREPAAALTVIDADGDRAAAVAAGSGLAENKVHVVDARDSDALAGALKGASVTVNAAQYETNIEVMRACLKAGCHYLDLGGMFHTTRQQLEFADDFESAGLSAVLGMGAAPGLSNLLAVTACKNFDRVDGVAMSFAAVARDMPDIGTFVPPYSIRTIMHEFCDPSFQFIDGELKQLPALAGRQRIAFPEPIGEVDCIHTLHSEPATLPGFLAERGVQEVSWRLGLPAPLETAVKAFAAAGFGSTTPLSIGNKQIAPLDFLATCIEQNIAVAGKATEVYTETGCLRAEAWYTTNTNTQRVVTQCVLETSGVAPDVAGVMTGTPAAIATLMLARGDAQRAGVHGPEGVIDPDAMFAELANCGFRTSRLYSEPIA